MCCVPSEDILFILILEVVSFVVLWWKLSFPVQPVASKIASKKMVKTSATRTEYNSSNLLNTW